MPSFLGSCPHYGALLFEVGGDIGFAEVMHGAFGFTAAPEAFANEDKIVARGRLQ